MSDRVPYPGFRWGVGPTHDWKDPEGPFHWTAFSPPDEDGFCDRSEGFTETREAAFAAVKSVPVAGRDLAA